MFLLTIFLLMLMPHLLGPLVIYLTQKSQAYPEFTVVNPRDLPPQIFAAFSRSREILAGQGFETVACLHKSELTTNVRAYLLLLVNRQTKEAALVYDMLADAGISSIHRSIIEFNTELSNGVEICTNTGTDPNPYRTYPEKLIYQFPEVKNPWALYKIHRQMVQPHAEAPGVYSVLPAEGDEIRSVSTSFTKTLMKQVEFGYLYLDEKASVFRPTIKGAILMTWKMAWPAGMIKRALIKRRARRIMSRFKYALAY
ncbi:MAG TPA: hypothetical protein VJS44_16450 [Pyrinomonadaceae bacterium]|nr:hypothetical protein [Pyrinomonadaceae bacterium]